MVIVKNQCPILFSIVDQLVWHKNALCMYAAEAFECCKMTADLICCYYAPLGSCLTRYPAAYSLIRVLAIYDTS